MQRAQRTEPKITSPDGPEYPSDCTLANLQFAICTFHLQFILGLRNFFSVPFLGKNSETKKTRGGLPASPLGMVPLLFQPTVFPEEDVSEINDVGRFKFAWTAAQIGIRAQRLS